MTGNHELGQYLRYNVAAPLQSHVALNCNMRLQRMLQYGMGSLATATTCHCSLQKGMVWAVRSMPWHDNETICGDCYEVRFIEGGCNDGWAGQACGCPALILLCPHCSVRACAFPAHNYPPIPRYPLGTWHETLGVAEVALPSVGNGRQRAFRNPSCSEATAGRMSGSIGYGTARPGVALRFYQRTTISTSAGDMDCS